MSEHRRAASSHSHVVSSPWRVDRLAGEYPAEAAARWCRAALGLAAAANFAGQLPVTLYLIAVAAVAVGTLTTAAAAMLAALALRRLPAAHLLAEE